MNLRWVVDFKIDSRSSVYCFAKTAVILKYAFLLEFYISISVPHLCVGIAKWLLDNESSLM